MSVIKKKGKSNMKRVILMLAMATGVMAHATDTCASFDDTGWQQGPSDDWFVNWDKAVAESRKSG